MTKAITLRLADADAEALARQAHQLQVSPGTMARILVHAGLSEDLPAARGAKEAIARLVNRSRQRPAGDAVALVENARASLGSHG